MQVEAVVLAGASNNGKLSDTSDEAYEALISVGDRPMVHYVFDALQTSKYVRSIVAVGPETMLNGVNQSERIALVSSAGSSMVENLRLGVGALGSTGPVLVVTSDIPLLRPEIVDDFIGTCMKRKAHIYYPIIRKEINEKEFPGVRRTYVRLKDGVFTGGNMVLMHPEVVPACEDVIAQAVALRKKPWQLSRLLGLSFIVKLLSRRLTLSEVEDRVETLLGFRGIGIECPYPEVGIDVDKPEDLRLVEHVLQTRR